jgi:hypothetical protein
LLENNLENKTFYRDVCEVNINTVNVVFKTNSWNQFSEIIQFLFSGGVSAFRLKTKNTYYAIGHNFKCCVMYIEDSRLSNDII